MGFEAIADDVVDPGESVEISFVESEKPEGVVFGTPSTTVVTILDGPSSPPASTMVTLAVSPGSVSEGAGSTGVTVTGTLNSAAFDSDTPVTVSVDNGTAIAGTDFASVSDFTLTIPANETRGTATFNLVPTNDDVDESDETLIVRGSAAGLAVDSATMTITDNDTAGVTVSPTSLTVTEGSNESYTVKLNSQPTGDVTVTVGGASGDVTVDKPRLTFTSGNWFTAQTVRVSADEDNDAVTDPQVRLDHTVSGGGYTGVTASDVTVDVSENDTASTKVTLSVNRSTVSEGDSATRITVTGTLDGAALTAATSVTVTVGDGTATSGTDFTAVGSFTLDIEADATEGTATFDLEPTDDEVAEGSETVTVSGSATGLDVEAATVTITDDDATPTKVILSVEPATVDEGDGSTQVTVTGTLDGAALTTNTVVEVSVGNSGSATAGTDFATVTSFDLTINANAMKGSATFNLVPTNDELAEGAETVVVSGTTTDLSVDSATVTIIDDDASGRVKLSMDGDSEWVMEGAGPTDVTVKAELTGGPRDEQTRVDVQLHAHEASADDFDAEIDSFRILIPANRKSATHTFRFTPTDDAEEERDENLRFTGDTGDLHIPVDPTTLMIKDNDGPSPGITLSVRPREVVEDAGPVRVRVTARLDGGPRPRRRRCR